MGRLTLKAAPGAKHPEIEFVKQPPGSDRSRGANAPIMKVRLTEPPVDGRANRAIEKWLTKLSGTPVQIVAGAGGRIKTVAFAPDEETFLAAVKKSLASN